MLALTGWVCSVRERGRGQVVVDASRVEGSDGPVVPSLKCWGVAPQAWLGSSDGGDVLRPRGSEVETGGSAQEDAGRLVQQA